MGCATGFQNGIDHVVFVAADIHGTLVTKLTYQEGPFQSQITTNAFEISAGSVTLDAPLGPTVVELGVAAGSLTAEQKAFYDLLLVANDGDTLPNDKGDFIKSLVDSTLVINGTNEGDHISVDRRFFGNELIVKSRHEVIGRFNAPDVDQICILGLDGDDLLSVSLGAGEGLATYGSLGIRCENLSGYQLFRPG